MNNEIKNASFDIPKAIYITDDQMQCLDSARRYDKKYCHRALNMGFKLNVDPVSKVIPEKKGSLCDSDLRAATKKKVFFSDDSLKALSELRGKVYLEHPYRKPPGFSLASVLNQVKNTTRQMLNHLNLDQAISPFAKDLVKFMAMAVALSFLQRSIFKQ